MSDVIIFSFGGDEGDRTPDLLTASQTLSQLSYAPNACDYKRCVVRCQEKKSTRNFRADNLSTDLIL